MEQRAQGWHLCDSGGRGRTFSCNATCREERGPGCGAVVLTPRFVHCQVQAGELSLELCSCESRDPASPEQGQDLGKYCSSPQ